jgi:hypothetical protein
LEDSICPKENFENLKQFLSTIEYSHLIRLYKATIDGFGASDFHKKCNGKQKVLILIKANNFVFGKNFVYIFLFFFLFNIY